MTVEEKELVESEDESNDSVQDKSFVQDILSRPENESFREKVLDFKEKMEKRNYLPYKETMNEIVNLQRRISLPLDVEDDGDLDEYCHLLDKIQAYKDRCVEILVRAHADYIFTDMYFNSLSKMWARYSTAKSQDRREGEAADILHFSIGSRSRSHEIFEAAKTMNFNFQAKYDTISNKLRVRIQEHRVTMDTHGVTTAAFKSLQKKGREKISEGRNPDDKEQSIGPLDWDQI